MNLLINCSILKKGGGLQVAHSIIYELREYPQNQYVLVLSPQVEEIVNKNDFGDNFTFILYSVKYSWSGKNSFLDKIVEQYKIEKVFTVFGPAYWKPKVFHISGYAIPHYVYKESPFFSQIALKEKIILKIKEIIHLHALRQSQILVTENEDVTKRLKLIIPNREIYTITNYYNQVFDNKDLWDQSVQLPTFDGVTLLTVTSNHTHKNLRIIPQLVYCLFKKNKSFKFRFVLTIKEEQMDQKLDNNTKEHLLFIGKVSINQCPYLYEQSDYMFLPTLLECFSASYAEAMYMKKPILTSDLGFAKGLCCDAAIYFNPLSAEDIANKIVMLSENRDLQKKFIDNGLSQLEKYDNYKERTKKYLEIIENM
jgi:glycosyltransferase involved in cell wall biosynthesis